MRSVNTAINRQLDGFQYCNQGCSPPSYLLSLMDYDSLSVDLNSARVVVPNYCFFGAEIYVDTQQKIALNVDGQNLNVWLSETGRGLSIPFLLQHLLLLQLKSFVHAAAIAVEDQGILLPAFGGIGKTAFIARATREPNVKTLGDDMIIVSKSGFLEPYLRPFALYDYHQALFPDFFAENQIQFKPLTLRWRVFNKTRTIIGDTLGREWHQPEHIVRTGYIPVAPQRILPSDVLETNPVPLCKICVMQRVDNLKHINLRELMPEEAVRFMLNVMYHEWYTQLRLLLSWLTFLNISAASYWTQVEQTMRSAIAQCQSIELLQIPLEMSSREVGEELVQHVIQS